MTLLKSPGAAESVIEDMTARKRKKEQHKGPTGHLLMEKLHIVVDALKVGLDDQSLIVNGSLKEASLDKDSVKSVLELLLRGVGGKSKTSETLAHVVLDTSGNLFSDRLVEESIASLECVRRIHAIVDGDGGSLKKPLILVTETDKNVKVVILCSTGSNNQTKLYFLDPISGSKSIQSQTKGCLFDHYLRLGSDSNSIKPLHGLIKEVSHSENIGAKCPRKEDSGWWCLLYCLLFVHQRTDPASSLASWIHNESIMRLKTILATHVEFLQKSAESQDHEKDQKRVSNTIYLGEFCKADQMICSELALECQKVEDNVQILAKMSKKERIKELDLREKAKIEHKQELERQIADLESIIAEGESSLASLTTDKATHTIELKYKHFLSGETLRTIENQMKKKEMKQRDNVLSHNQSVHEEVIKEQIAHIRELIETETRENQKRLDVKNRKTAEKNGALNDIESHENEISVLKNDIAQLDNRLLNLKRDEKKLEVSIQSLNSVYTSNTSKLIELLQLHEPNNVKKIDNKLKQLQSESSDLNRQNTELKKRRNDWIDEKQQAEVELDLEKTRAKNSANTKSQIESKRSELKKTLSEYDTWYWRYWYSSDVEKLESDLNRENNRLNQETETLNRLNKSIENYHERISTLESNIKETKSKLDKTESEISRIQYNINEQTDQLIKIHKTVLSRLREEVKSVSSSIKSDENNKIGHEADIISCANQIDLAKERVRNLDKEISATDRSIVFAQKKIVDWENEIRKMEDNIEKFKVKQDVKRESKSKPLWKTAKKKFLMSKSFEINKRGSFESDIVSLELEKQLEALCDISGQKWKLLYRASRDGFDANSFHTKCDQNHNTLTLITTSDSNIFGGYTSAAWSQDGRFKDDPYTYVFSLKNTDQRPFKVKCNNSTEAIFCDRYSGPCFGYDDIKIADMSNENDMSISDFGYTFEHQDYPYMSDQARSILAGSFNFTTTEIEVFVKDYPPLTQSQIDQLIKNKGLEEQAIKDIYETFNALAINQEVDKKTFVAYLEQEINFFKNEQELKEIRSLLELMFAKFDADGSGKIDFEEFLDSKCMFMSQDANEIPKIVFGFFFEKADVDKNGSLDRKELEELIKQFPCNLALKDLNSYLSKVSKTGAVSKEQGVKLFSEFYGKQ